jgi:hypothetical protein
MINDVLASLFEQAGAPHMYRFATTTAEAVDARIRALPSSLAAEIIEKDSPRRLHRHLHRAHHLDAIVAILRHDGA